METNENFSTIGLLFSRLLHDIRSISDPSYYVSNFCHATAYWTIISHWRNWEPSCFLWGCALARLEKNLCGVIGRDHIYVTLFSSLHTVFYPGINTAMAGNKDMMERVDMKAEFSKLSPTEQHFVKKGVCTCLSSFIPYSLCIFCLLLAMTNRVMNKEQIT